MDEKDLGHENHNCTEAILPSISMTEETDRALTEEEFSKIVDDLTDSFCLLRWRWAGAPGTLGISQIETGINFLPRPADC